MKKKIGLLFSLTGTTSIVEVGQHEACLLAIELANKDYDVQMDPVTADIKSDPSVTAKSAYDLLKNDKVDMLVGCYTSSCRKALIPVLEETGGSLLYPTIYEGEESHPQVFYFGAVPNQEVDPLLSWTINSISERFVLVGSDYIYPRSINKQVRSFVENAGGFILNEIYFHLGCTSFDGVLHYLTRRQRNHQPFVVFSTLVGTSAPAFYTNYKKAGLLPPIVSPITSEVEFAAMGNLAASGSYFSDGHLEPASTPSYRRFVQEYRIHYGNKPINGIMESAYDAVRLLALCYSNNSRHSTTDKPTAEKLRSTINTWPLQSRQGTLMMDSHTQHAWLWTRIARVRQDGEIEVIWMSPGPMPPRPYGDLATPSHFAPSTEIRTEDPFHKLIGRDAKFVECVRMARIAARTSCSVLLVGETGTGKELFARAIHAASPRHDRPFVPIDCAAIPSDLIASELFGYEGGSFTGSRSGGRPGKFEIANGGTIFLDEIAEMPGEQQVTLLRVLQEKEIYRIGGKKPIRIDVRIIAATNRDVYLETDSKNKFRRDLYYRLNVFSIALPLLRDRKGDIVPIANYMLKQLNYQNSTNKSFSRETLEVLESYSWPGNVRELANVIERAFYLSSGSDKILPINLAKEVTESVDTRFLTHRTDDCTPTRHAMNTINRRLSRDGISSMSIEAHEFELISQAITQAGFNISRAARMLGIHRSTLYRKVNKFGITISREFPCATRDKA